MTHPPFAALLDYVEGALSTEARAEVEEHLAEPCPQCRADLARLRAVLDALANDDALPPPETALRRAVAAFRPHPTPRLRVPARLVSDNYR